MFPRLALVLLLVACPPADPDDPALPGDPDPPEPAFTDLPTGQWSFVPVEGMRCGDGSATGIGVHPGSTQGVLFIVAGGGACWDALTCFGLNTAVNLRGEWGAAKLAAETGALDGFPLLDRARDDNPFAAATWVYVPYCTGDLHAGASEQAYVPWEPQNIVHHAGDGNMRALLSRVAQEIPSPDDVWAIGLSAGGYGVQLQADRFAATWPEAELALLADGAPMVRPYGDRRSAFHRAWSLRTPDGCEDCDEGFPQILAHQAASLPDARLGLLTFRRDAVVTVYLNYPAGHLAGATDRLLDDLYGAPPLAAFVVDTDAHVMIGELERQQADDGTPLRAWIDAWATGGAGFVDAR